MKLDVGVRELGPVNHLPLKQAAQAIHVQAWLEDTLRQMAFAEQHGQTQSIILLFSETWPKVNVVPRSGWQYFSQPAGDLVAEVLGKHYRPGGTVIRALLAKLLPGGSIAEHVDTHPSFAHAHRIHVPLVTNEQVEFRVAGQNHRLREGIAYEISNLDRHSVANPSDEARIHFIFDYVDGA